MMKHAEELVLDGNAAAGLLSQIFVAEMTTARFTCAWCGASRPLGAARFYESAGAVLRCTDCSGVLLRVVMAPERAFIELTGIRRLEMGMPPT
jgi:Family of unknown function (DUF6510)